MAFSRIFFKIAQPLKVSQQNVLYHMLRMHFSLYGMFQNFIHFILVNQYFFSINQSKLYFLSNFSEF